mgnify:FL=1
MLTTLTCSPCSGLQNVVARACRLLLPPPRPVSIEYKSEGLQAATLTAAFVPPSIAQESISTRLELVMRTTWFWPSDPWTRRFWKDTPVEAETCTCRGQETGEQLIEREGR